MNKWRITFEMSGVKGIYGEGTDSEGIYTDGKLLFEDYDQCIFLQPENNYNIEEYDECILVWKTADIDRLRDSLYE